MSDTLATLQAALAPKTGMKRIPFPLESYQHRSPALSSKRLLNFYSEQEPADARVAAALMPTPGLVPYGASFGTGPVLALNNDYPGTVYGISGTHAWRLSRPLVGGPIQIDDMGDMGAIALDEYPSNFMPTIAVGVNAVVFCMPPRAYTCGHAPGSTINQIGGDFPGARSVAYLDGYFVFTANEITSQFFISELLDPSAFDALDFAFADGVPNVLRRAMVLRGELWFVGDHAIEVWYDSGDADFPFRRRSGGVIQQGTATMHSAAICDDSLFYVTETGMVLRSNGYQMVRVSTHAIEDIIRIDGAHNGVSAIAYTQDGHPFYCITYAEHTLCYDCATKVWHERSSAVDGTTRWRPGAIAQRGGEIIMGDSASGTLMLPDPAISTDMGIDPERIAILPSLWAGTNRAFCSRLEIEMEVGGVTPGGYLHLAWSDDAGLTWQGWRPLQTGLTSDYRGRVFTTRLGSFRQRIFLIQAHHRVTLYAVSADIVAGAH